MAPVLALMGIDAVTSGSIIAMGALLGMIAPPVNTAALIICAGIDVPYVGFEGSAGLNHFPVSDSVRAFTRLQAGTPHGL